MRTARGVHLQHNELDNTDVNSVDIACYDRNYGRRSRSFNEEARGDVPAADLLFTGVRVHRNRRAAPRPRRRRHRRPHHGGRARVRGASALIGERTRFELDGALLSPGFQDAHVHPIGAGVELLMCNLAEATDAADAVARVEGLRRREPRRGVDPRRRLVDGPLPRRRADARAARRGRARPAGAAHEPRPPQHVGEHRGDRARRARRVHPRPRRRPHRARADGSPAGTFHEGAERPVRRRAARRSATTCLRRPAAGAGGAPRARHHRLAGRVVGGLSGRPGRRCVYRARSPRAPCAPTSSAPSGGSATAASTRSTRWSPAARIRRLGAGPLSLGTTKIMVDGVAENQTAAMLTPYRDAHGHDTDNSGPVLHRPRPAREIRHRARRRRIPGALPRARRPRRTRGARRARGGPRPTAPPTAGTTSPTCRSSRTVETARFAELDAVANIQALWATHEDQIDELTLPFLQDGAEARQYPFGDLVRHGARLAAGSDWPVSSADPMDAIHIAVNRVAPGSTPSRSAAPTSASTWPRRWPPTPRAPPT